MHGLINRALQSFACATFGTDRWRAAALGAGLDPPEYEAMLVYDEALSRAVFDALCAETGREADDLCEDLGTYLVSSPRIGALRRLLRFGGDTYPEFLHSLDDLSDRARLAVADLHLPMLDLWEEPDGRYRLTCAPGLAGFGHVMLGVLRAMADEHGALVMLEHRGATPEGGEEIAITLVETTFAQGRRFDLGARVG